MSQSAKVKRVWIAPGNASSFSIDKKRQQAVDDGRWPIFVFRARERRRCRRGSSLLSHTRDHSRRSRPRAADLQWLGRAARRHVRSLWSVGCGRATRRQQGFRQRIHGATRFADGAFSLVYVRDGGRRFCSQVRATIVRRSIDSFSVAWAPTFVIKEDGLCAGKGVFIETSVKSALERLAAIYAANESASVVIEGEC